MFSDRDAHGIAGLAAFLAIIAHVIAFAVLGIATAMILKIIDLIVPGAPAWAAPKFKAVARFSLKLGTIAGIAVVLMTAAATGGYGWIIYVAAGISAVLVLYAYRRPFARKLIWRALAVIWTLTALAWLLPFGSYMNLDYHKHWYEPFSVGMMFAFLCGIPAFIFWGIAAVTDFLHDKGWLDEPRGRALAT